MKSHKSLTRYFKSAAAFDNATQLFSEDELHSMLENAPVSYPPNRVIKPSHRWRNVMLGSTILAGTTAALMWFSLRPGEQQYQQSARLPSEQVIAQERAAAAPITPQMQDVVPPAASNAQHIEGLPEATMHSTATLEAGVSLNIPSHIKGIRTLDLKPEELKALGVSASDEGWSLLTQLSYAKSDPVALNVFASNSGIDRSTVVLNQSKLGAVVKALGYDDTQSTLTFRVTLDTFSLGSRLEYADSVTAPAVYPVIITHDSKDLRGVTKSQVLIFGNRNNDAAQHARYGDELATLFDLYQPAQARSTKDLSSFPLLSKLIPVRINLGRPDVNGSEIILWYYPDDAFLSILPKSLGDNIRKERDAIRLAEDRHAADSTQALIEPRFHGDYTYTDVNRAHSGSLEILSIGPNPARDQATLRFALRDNRVLSAVLYDMSGQRVAVLQQDQNFTAGTNDIPIDLSQLSSGAYLITLISDRHEQAIQRLIIQK